MTVLRPSLPVHVAQHLEGRMRQGDWANRLPSERKLAAELGVSRGTLRAALELLRDAGKISANPKGHLISLPPAPPTPGTRPVEVGLLSPRALAPLRPYLAMLIAQLKEGARTRGWALHLHHGGSFFSRSPTKALRRLVDNYRYHGWILVHATPTTQSWFERERVPTLVSGHTYAGISLPSVDINHRAVGRHLGVMLRRFGHRHVIMVSSRPSLPGLGEGEAGLREGLEGRGDGDHRVDPLPYDGRDAILAQRLLHQLRARPRPTCIVTETPNQYLTALSALASARLTVPADVSLVSRLNDPFLHHLIPAPTRYHLNPVTMARHILTRMAHLVEGEKLSPPAYEVIAEFMAGASLRNQTK
jgi:DNA-binding LacI/PurR family transcriptional regulator/biotin operon repressor